MSLSYTGPKQRHVRRLMGRSELLLVERTGTCCTKAAEKGSWWWYCAICVLKAMERQTAAAVRANERMERFSKG